MQSKLIKRFAPRCCLSKMRVKRYWGGVLFSLGTTYPVVNFVWFDKNYNQAVLILLSGLLRIPFCFLKISWPKWKFAEFSLSTEKKLALLCESTKYYRNFTHGSSKAVREVFSFHTVFWNNPGISWMYPAPTGRCRSGILFPGPTPAVRGNRTFLCCPQ